MSDLDDLYRDVLLDHYKNPRNHGRLEGAEVSVEGVNPLCGDQITLTAKLEGDVIRDVKIEGRGCSISQASGSMMTEALKGKTLAQAQALVKDFKGMMLEGRSADDLPDELGDTAALEGVKKFPVRIKCALLAWNTFLEGLLAFGEKKSPVIRQHRE